jgi:hypothetical protein
MATSTTAKGMRNYKPRRPEMTADDVVTPESRARIDAMVQEAKDEAMLPKIKKAYDASGSIPTDYKKGGTASSRADGIAQKGKTRGKMC